MPTNKNCQKYDLRQIYLLVNEYKWQTGDLRRY